MGVSRTRQADGELMRILLWHVHGSWTTSFVQGSHEYVVPVNAARDGDGRGRAQTWSWPESVVERTPQQLAAEHFDLVILQRPHEEGLAQAWSGRRAGVDVPAIYLEHNTPPDPVGTMHPMHERKRIPIVHVTHFNRLVWDCGAARTRVIEHGIVDPGHRFTGEWPRAAVVINDPVRRGRAVGTDLLRPLAAHAPIDLFGMRVNRMPPIEGMWTFEDLPQYKMHMELARRRVYVHTARWTSLGLSLLEAMHLGLPVVALDATEISRAVPSKAGVVSNDLSELARAVSRFINEPMLAQQVGAEARAFALGRYGLNRFLAEWDVLLEEVMHEW